MREWEMARFVIRKLDRFINFLTIAVMISGGLFIHILTALTIKSYYGSPWGYVSFFLPGIAEFYLVALQLSESMYNYMILLAGFISVVTALCVIRHIKNICKSRMETAVEF